MKLSEFKQLIREEIKKCLNESSIDKVKSLGWDPSKEVTYKVGKGSRYGMLIDVKQLKSVISTIALKNIESLENAGVVFEKAYVSVIEQKFGKVTITYSLIGKDSKNNEFIYDKYEGNTPGFGQTFVFVNGVKQNATDYMSSTAVNLPSKQEINDFFKKLTKGDVSIGILTPSKIRVYTDAEDDKNTVESAYQNLLKNKAYMTTYFNENNFPKNTKVDFVELYGGYRIQIHNNKSKDPLAKVLKSFNIN